MSFLYHLIKPIAYISLPAILFRSIAKNSPASRYYVRLGLYLSTLTVVAAWGAIVAASMSLVGRRYDVNYIVARSFYLLAGRVLDMKVQIEGEEHVSTRPAVLMSNHQSMLDILILGRIFPKQASIMAKKELQWTPLGPFMSMSGALFVDRGNNPKAVRSMEAAGSSMKSQKTSLWIYPEGTRTSGEEPSMLPLKKGGFYLAIQAGIPIIPIVTENYWRLYHQGTFEEGTIKVRVLPPIPTTGLTTADVSELANRVRDQMLVALREISITVPSTPIEPLSAIPEPYTAAPSRETPKTIPTLTSSEHPGLTRKDIPDSTDSISSFGTSSAFSSGRIDGSENGTETEEDDGMILVGRPGSA